MSPRTRRKLAEKHSVSEDEVRQCFENMEGNLLKDRREDHQSDVITWWFVAETNRQRKLKVCFVIRRVETTDGPKTFFEVKTAYPPNADEIALYDRYGKC